MVRVWNSGRFNITLFSGNTYEGRSWHANTRRRKEYVFFAYSRHARDFHMDVLKAREISVVLKGQTILNKISFVIRQGEQWAITGPSGSGKTTLLKALTGRQFFTGTLTIHGSDDAVGQDIILFVGIAQFNHRSVFQADEFCYTGWYFIFIMRHVNKSLISR